MLHYMLAESAGGVFFLYWWSVGCY